MGDFGRRPALANGPSFANTAQTTSYYYAHTPAAFPATLAAALRLALPAAFFVTLTAASHLGE